MEKLITRNSLFEHYSDNNKQLFSATSSSSNINIVEESRKILPISKVWDKLKV